MINTQEELLAMPACDYMNEEQLDYFKRLLSAQLAEAQERVDTARETMKQSTRAPDPADWATADEAHHANLRDLERNQILCKKIVEALARIDEGPGGPYGWCDMYGTEIGLRRMLSRPTTNLSIEAKEHQEKLERHRYQMRGAA
jgi:DnaK suppressor protein